MEYENSIAKTILEAVLAFFLPFLVCFLGIKRNGIRNPSRADHACI